MRLAAAAVRCVVARAQGRWVVLPPAAAARPVSRSPICASDPLRCPWRRPSVRMGSVRLLHQQALSRGSLAPAGAPPASAAAAALLRDAFDAASRDDDARLDSLLRYGAVAADALDPAGRSLLHAAAEAGALRAAKARTHTPRARYIAAAAPRARRPMRAPPLSPRPCVRPPAVRALTARDGGPPPPLSPPRLWCRRLCSATRPPGVAS